MCIVYCAYYVPTINLNNFRSIDNLNDLFFQYPSTRVTGPSMSSPVSNKVRSEFDVFDFDADATDEVDKMRCSADHYSHMKVFMANFW